MKSILKSAVVGLAFAAAAFGMNPAKADVIMASAKSTLCLDVNNNTQYVALWGCHGGANQNFFVDTYGAQIYGGRCLDHGPLRDKKNGNGDLVMLPCTGAARQRWALVGNPRDINNGRLRNEEGWCVNIPGGMGRAVQGQGLIVWTCQQGVTYSTENDMWVRGKFGTAATFHIPVIMAASVAFQQAGNIFVPSSIGAKLLSPNGGNVIAAGGGNVIAAGGGNVIAAGGGNVIAAGGGNVMFTVGGAVIAAGGGNIISLPNQGNITSVVGPAAGSLVNVGAWYHQ